MSNLSKRKAVEEDYDDEEADVHDEADNTYKEHSNARQRPSPALNAIRSVTPTKQFHDDGGVYSGSLDRRQLHTPEQKKTQLTTG